MPRTVASPAALVRMVGASSARGWVLPSAGGPGAPPPSGVDPFRDPVDIRRMIDETPVARVAGCARTSPLRERTMAAFEAEPVSAPVAAFSAASRAAAAWVGRAPDSSSRTGQIRLFQSAWRSSHTGDPTSP